MSLSEKTFDQITTGEKAVFNRTITAEDVNSFLLLSGDTNPLHHDEEYARTTPFKQCLVPGMLLGSLCSKLVGVYLPGKNCLYVSQDLQFKQPVYFGDVVTVKGVVTNKSQATKLIEIAIEMTVGSNIVMTGTARVLVRT